VNQMVMLWSLQKHGCRVDTAANGGDALTTFGREGYDVVLLDLNLPDWRGQDVAREMREAGLDFGGHIPVSEMNHHEGLAYHELTAVLWRAVQELAAKLEARDG